MAKYLLIVVQCFASIMFRQPVHLSVVTGFVRSNNLFLCQFLAMIRPKSDVREEYHLDTQY